MRAFLTKIPVRQGGSAFHSLLGAPGFEPSDSTCSTPSVHCCTCSSQLALLKGQWLINRIDCFAPRSCNVVHESCSWSTTHCNSFASHGCSKGFSKFSTAPCSSQLALLQERPKIMIKTSEERNEMVSGTNGDSGKGGVKDSRIYFRVYTLKELI